MRHSPEAPSIQFLSAALAARSAAYAGCPRRGCRDLICRKPHGVRARVFGSESCQWQR